MGCMLETFRGDTYEFLVELTDQDGNSFNLTGYICTFSMKKNEDDAAYILQKVGVNQVPLSDGKVLFTILPTDTQNLDCRKYVCDIEVKKDSDHVYTPDETKGFFEIKKDITRPAP